MTQDEVRDPRQVWARRTWVADRGVWCDRARSLDKFSVAPLRLAHTEIGSVLSGPYLNWVCSVWSIPKHRSVSSGPYPIFGLVNTQTSVCFVWSISNLRSASSGPYPSGPYRSVRCGPFPIVGLFRLVHTQSSVSF